MRNERSIGTAAATALAAGAAVAHPGHDATSSMGLWEGFVHLLTQPDHVAMLIGVPMLVLVVVAIAAASGIRRRSGPRR